MSTQTYLTLSIDQGIATLVINRPEVYNALTRDAKLELINTITSLSTNPDVQVLVLTGAGKAFCTGQDLNDRTIKASEQKVDLAVTLKEEWVPLVEAIRKCPKVVIAAVNGVAAGAGVSIALASDFIVMHPAARFVSSFAKIGLVPDAGSTFQLTRELGQKRAMEFFLLRDDLKSEELLSTGIVTALSENVLESAYEMSQRIKTLAPLSVKEIKHNIQMACELSYNESVAKEVDAQGRLGASEDYQEGLKAFFEKRRANFKGK
jgi:2-(1,2-epoxy-1,2-dihydrophenyl)acetyl-CoA isomerase